MKYLYISTCDRKIFLRRLGKEQYRLKVFHNKNQYYRSMECNAYRKGHQVEEDESRVQVDCQ